MPLSKISSIVSNFLLFLGGLLLFSVLTILKTRLVVLDVVLCVSGITGRRKPVSSYVTKFLLMSALIAGTAQDGFLL
jgi:hypothetical protein